MKPSKTWILVADASRAKIFEHRGPGKGLTELPGESFEQSLAATHEIGTERPGRSFDSAGKGRHAMTPRVDWHEQAKQDFTKAIGAHLNAARAKNAFDRLILVAPPKTLGQLRESLDGHTSDLVIGTLNKDLTAINRSEIETHLADLIAV